MIISELIAKLEKEKNNRGDSEVEIIINVDDGCGDWGECRISFREENIQYDYGLGKLVITELQL